MERRELLAGDLLASNDLHNYARPYDVNADGEYTASDAVAIINQLSNADAAVGELASDAESEMFFDVNSDDRVSAADALGVINALARGESAPDELIELYLTARTVDDVAITPDVNGDINVGVNEPFDLEVSYVDLRDQNIFSPDPRGALQIYAAITGSQAGVLEPILNETQRFALDKAILNSAGSDTLTFTSETGQVVTRTVAEFGNPTNVNAGYTNVLEEFGYERSEFRIAGNLLPTDSPFAALHDITFLGDEFGDVDVPNITITSSFAADNNLTIEVAARNPDGTINSDAIEYNINFDSRTFNNELFYNQFPAGGFVAATGFDDTGGSALTRSIPPDGGGNTPLTDYFLNSPTDPFDVFSLRVRLTQAVSDFEVSVNKGSDQEAILLADLPTGIDVTDVLVDEDSIVTFNATAEPEPPIAGDDTLAVTEDMATTLDLASLLSGGTFDSLTVTTNGSRGSGSIAGTTLTYTPNMDDNGLDTIVYTATNAFGSDTGTIAVNIAAVNDPPVPDDDSFNTVQDVALTIQLADLLDGDSTGAANENDTLTVVAVSDPVNAGATTSLNGTVIYTPAAGFTGTDTFTYTVSDGTDEVSATVTINVAVEPAPNAGNSSLAVVEDNANTLDLTSLLSGGPTDMLTITTNGNRGVATLNGNVLTYTPNMDDNGSDTIVYTASNDGGSDTGTISVNISAVNDPPVAAAQSFDATANRTLTIQLVDLLDGANTGAANEADTLTVTAVGDPSNAGSMTTLNGVVTYTPAAGFEGNDSFTYTISDGGLEDTATVSITVTQIAPVAGDSSLSAPENGMQTIDLAPLLTAGGVADSVMITTNGQLGTATLNGLMLTYTPNQGVSTGSDSIVYTATNTAGSDTGTIAVTITNVNQTPTVSPISVSFSEQDGSSLVDLLTNANDPDGDALTISDFTLVSGNGAGVTAPAGNSTSLTVNPDAYGSLVDNENSPIVYSFNVNDSEFSVANQITITINGFNDPPRANDDNNVTAFLNVVQDIVVLGNDDAGVGEEGQALTVISATSVDGNATVTPNADGTVRFTPDTDFTGPTSFTYTIQDAGGKTDTATVNVTVEDFNPSSISGSIFIDHIENLTAVISDDAAPIRNGHKDSDEAGLGSVHVNLFSAASDNVSGATISIDTLTTVDGFYGFDDIAPGTYTVTPTVEGSSLSATEKLIYLGPGEIHVGIALEGGQSVTQIDFPVLATTGNALNNLDLLASTFLRSNTSAADASNSGREGGVASLAADGSQNFITVGEGYDGVRFAELVLNEDRDAALLTVVEEDGDILSTRLNRDDFVVSNGSGYGVQFFGGLDDFDFVPVDDLIREEFAQFRNSIDMVLGEDT